MSRLLLVGCGKSKADRGCAARDLSTGNLFSARARYAEATGQAWWILSAGYGLVSPDEVLEPYDVTMAKRPALDRAGWAVGVLGDLLAEFADGTQLRDVCVEIHAGADYVEQLRDLMRALGMSVTTPVEGIGIGEQLAWYGEQTRSPLVRAS